jgi:hypothetical protein
MLRPIRALVTPAELAICGDLPGVVDVWADDGREWRTVGARHLAELANLEGLELFDVYGRRVKSVARDVLALRRNAATVCHAAKLALAGRW